MADDYKALAKQIARLTDRLTKLEHSVGSTPPYGGTGSDDEAARFCAVPEVPERPLGADVSPDRARLIRYIEKKWMNGTKLHYTFFNTGPWAGPEVQKDIVRQGFDVWRDVGIGIEFEETSQIADAEVRIGFLQGDGAWSYVGRDVIDVPGQHERTMNFGWDLTRDPRGVDVPVHEIGHTLGFPHEHQNPFAGIVWEEEAVYDYFGGPPNNWPRNTTFFNILRKLPAAAVEGSEWDPDSIMHYAFPAGLIRRPEQYQGGINPAAGLSEQDLEEVRRFYPPIHTTSYPKLEPFRLQLLSLTPAQQQDYAIEPAETREYTTQTFGRSDTVMVLFEDRDGDLSFVAGDDDSGSSRNSRITEWLQAGRRYVLRVRLYLNYASGDTALLLW